VPENYLRRGFALLIFGATAWLVSRIPGLAEIAAKIPLHALAGGLAIGFASALLLAGSGKIAGISGIVGGLLRGGATDRLWRAIFTAGLVLGAWLMAHFVQTPVSIAATPLQLTLAGLLVGFGTQLGNGCTSGHGVCGIARRSGRSVTATLVFMGVAAATVFACRHIPWDL
jgi:uncharacterized membrane protein YedE/YeeE